MVSAIRVAIVDDHPLYRDGVAMLLSCSGSFDIVGEGGCADDAIRIVEAEKPDVIILDLNMPGGGLSAASHLKQSHPGTKIVMLTVSETAGSVLSALTEGGASAYVLKGVTGPELESVVRRVHDGSRYVSPELAASVLAHGSNVPVRPTVNDFSRLSRREVQISTLVSDGLTNKQIARQLTLSDKTVKHYMTIIMQKLQVRTRLELALMIKDGRMGLAQSPRELAPAN